MIKFEEGIYLETKKNTQKSHQEQQQVGKKSRRRWFKSNMKIIHDYLTLYVKIFIIIIQDR